MIKRISSKPHYKFDKGDLVVSNLSKVFPEDREWYGIVINIHPDAPKMFPVYEHKYHIQWMGGAASWCWAPNLKLAAKGRSK